MHVLISAVGRAKPSPETDLVETFLTRANGLGPGLGFQTIALREVEEKKRLEGDQLKAREGELLLNTVPTGGALIALDERGRDLGSEDFAGLLARRRDDGTPALVFAIGGANGHGRDLRGRAEMTLRFGTATWPHMMVRAMLAEQIYRGLTIVAGHPYHRGD